ncbi:hypothetical protein CHU98_g6343 [Xylaria longipes]|nr:hypothetical protein CHU98_g6343 [Xylaria longipes]
MDAHELGEENEESDISCPGLPDVPTTRFRPIAPRNTRRPHPLSSELNPFMPNPVPQNASPFVVRPSEMSMVNPHGFQSHRSPDIGPAWRNWQPSGPYLEEHLLNSDFNLDVDQAYARAYTQRKSHKQGAHSINVSGPPQAPKTHKHSRWQRGPYSAPNSRPLRLGDQSPDQPGNSGPDDSSVNNSGNIGTGLTIPSRISTCSIPTSVGETSFQYRPIQATEFRLVRLLPENRSMIKCEILHASLEAGSEALKYIAVSYTWGDVDPNIKIQVDGYPFYVTPNLHGALRRLRKQHESIMVW